MKLKISTLLLALTVVAATGCSNSSNNSQTTGESTTTPATSEHSADNSGTTSTETGSQESSMDNSATSTDTGSNESTESTDTSSIESTTASDLTTKDVAKVIEKQGIKLTSQPKEDWVLNNVKPDRYVTSSDAKQAEPVSIYVFDSSADLEKGMKDLETQVNGVPFRKTEYTKGNVLVIYWFEPALNDGSTEKGKLDAELKKAVNSL
ncbi:hypothetical protein ACE3MZ_08965 [Paenibacillus sp. WLX1005]|uniref:hypothetical protein n=1 Tax=Paenibacillus sp. WLX1005 TaxID=3243766 RepID=UPI0039840BEA